MIYRISAYDQVDGHQGYVWRPTLASAEQYAREWRQTMGGDPDRYTATIAARQTPRTKAQIVALLNAVAGHPDNG